MKTASLNELRKELFTLSEEQLRDTCLRIIKHKKENKELLHYLVFEASNEQEFISAIKEDITEEFAAMNMTNLYWAKKTIRKILRTINKYIRFSGQKQTEIELRLFFCQQIKETGLRIDRSQALLNLYKRQVRSIEKALAALHPDLQFDFKDDLMEVRSVIK